MDNVSDASQQQAVWKTYVRNLWWHVNPALLRAEATKVVDPQHVFHVKVHRVGIMDRPDKMCSAFITMNGQQAATELSRAWNGSNIPCLSKFELESSAIGEMMPTPRPMRRLDPVVQQQQAQVPNTSRRTPVVVPPRFPRNRADTEKKSPPSASAPRSHPTNVDDTEAAAPKEEMSEEGEKKDKAAAAPTEEKPAEGENNKAEAPKEEKPAEGENNNKAEAPKEEGANADKTKEGEQDDCEGEAKEEKAEEEEQKLIEEMNQPESREKLPDGQQPRTAAPNDAGNAVPAPLDDDRTVFSHPSSDDEGSHSSETTLDLGLHGEQKDENAESDKETSPALLECKQESDQESALEPVAELVPLPKREPDRSTSRSEQKRRKRKEKKKRKRKRHEDHRRDTTASEEESGHHHRRDHYHHHYSRERQPPWQRRQALRRDRTRHFDDEKARWIHYVLFYKK